MVLTMAVTQRRELSPEDTAELLAARERRDQAAEDYKRVVLKMLDRSSFATVAKVAQVSPTTLQAWKRDAQ
jgi:hypothetical protein